MKGIDTIVCDLDGTLFDVRHRQHLAQGGAWDEFHSAMEADTPRPVVLAFLKAMSDLGNRIIFLTGRPETYRARTELQLKEKCHLWRNDDYIDLLMRAKDQYGSDTVIKESLLREFAPSMFEESKKPSVLFLDDRDKVVAHFRDLGFEVWQVNEGAF